MDLDYKILDTLTLSNIINKNKDDWKLFSENCPYGTIIGVFDDDELIAATAFAMYDNEMHIHLFEVIPSYQKCGCGKELYNYLKDIATFQSLHCITLDYLNKDAESFWKRMGFVADENNLEESMIKYL